MSFSRRLPLAPPQLHPLIKPLSLEEMRQGKKYPDNVGLWTEESIAALMRFLRDAFHTQEGGLPAGQFTGVPTEVEAGVDGETGSPALGWATGLHRHHVNTDSAVGLANLNGEGVASSLARSDHLHKRDVRAKAAGSDVATRNALDFRSSSLVEWSILDDSVNDEVDVTPNLTAAARLISRGGTVLAPTVPQNVIIWYAPFTCTVLNVRGYRVGGSATGTFINARRNGTSTHLASNLELTSADTWMDGGAVQNTAYAIGDKLELMLTGLGATLPTQVAIQVDFQRT